MVWDRSVLEKLSAGKLVKICHNKSENVSECRRFKRSSNRMDGKYFVGSLNLIFNFFTSLLSERESFIKQIKTF